MSDERPLAKRTGSIDEAVAFAPVGEPATEVADELAHIEGSSVVKAPARAAGQRRGPDR